LPGIPDHGEHFAGAHLAVTPNRFAGVPLQLVEDVLHPDIVDRERRELESVGLGRAILMDGTVV
jgi:hypothetical protein